jgi:hypothetical protein
MASPPNASGTFLERHERRGNIVHLRASRAHLIVSRSAERESAMRTSEGRRLAWSMLFAVLAGVAVAWVNPADRIKADLRADADGLVISLEYAANAVEG